MIPSDTKCILLDIEGTTSSIAFVYEVMFAYVRRHIDAFLASHPSDFNVQQAIAQMASDAGRNAHEMFGRSECDDSADGELARKKIVDHVHQLMDADQKSTGLKALQGLIWKGGFDDGSLRAHLYPDVHSALLRWKSMGIDLRIYSSGSIAAQKLFFGHTEYGDLLPLFSAHYDTTIGSKKESSSYQRIAADAGCLPAEILFISDSSVELEAALAAGMRVIASCRPGNAELPKEVGYQKVDSFDEV